MVSKPIQVTVEAEGRLRSLIKVAKPKRKEPSFTELVNSACDIIENNPLKALQFALREIKVWYTDIYGSRGLERLEEFLILFFEQSGKKSTRRQDFGELIEQMYFSYKDDLKKRPSIEVKPKSIEGLKCSGCQGTAIRLEKLYKFNQLN